MEVDSSKPEAALASTDKAQSPASSARPKRKTAAKVNYKESGENDDFSRFQTNEQSSKTTGSFKQPKKQQQNSKVKTSIPGPSSANGIVAPSNGNHSQSPTTPNGYLSVDDEIPLNWQPPIRSVDRFNHILDLKTAKVENNVLTMKDGTKVRKNDHIYMVCEPPGEPYYIARVTGFVKKDKANSTKNAKNFNFKVCWFYRPRDLNRHSVDSRLLYATLHSDECPIQSFRGLVTVKHKIDIKDLDQYRASANCFYFDKLYDRYMIKMYDVLPTVKLINLPTDYYKALNKRYEFVFVEVGRGSDLMTAPKNCEKCSQWCSSADSIDCHKCGKYYHMLCLDPPIFSKPKRGFGWYCAKCSRDLEIELHEKRGKMLEQSGSYQTDSDMELDSESMDDQASSDQDQRRAESEEDSVPKYERMAAQFLENDSKLSLKQRRDLEEWPYRYLGVHAKFEDALDLQDRPYPLAASRLGTRHQCTGIPEWFDHIVQYYDKTEPKGKPKKSAKTSKRAKGGSPSPSPEQDEKPLPPVPEEFKDLDPVEYPPWLQERPKGYVERGGHDTSVLMWRQPDSEEAQEMVATYVANCARYAESLGLLRDTPNFMDAILKVLLDNAYDPEKAIKVVAKFTRESLMEPTFSAEEVAKFEAAVRKHGSELYPVYKEVGSQSSANIVRFYYLWKKTPNGHAIWDNYEGRPKNRLKNQKSKGDLDDSGDDSAFDRQKVSKCSRDFECKHCHTTKSLQWFRVSGVSQDNKKEPMLALCFRCARLWRRYGVEWDDPSEVTKKQPQKSNWKRKVEAELLEDAERVLAARAKYRANPKKISGVQGASSPLKRKSVGDVNPEVEDLPVTPKKTKPDGGLPRLKIEKPKKKSSPVKQEQTDQAFTVVMDVPDISSVILRQKEQLLQIEKCKPENRLKERYDSKFKVPIPDFLEDEDAKKTANRPAAPKMPLLFHPSSRPCCVCRETNSPESVVICNNCGLNVHASCYGVKLFDSIDKDPFTKVWYCDVCSNDCHPVIRTQYSCSLCLAREVDHDSAIKGSKSAVPDALKRTENHRWCHVMCSMFSPHCTYGNAQMLQPIKGIEETLLQNVGKTCWACQTHGGSLTRCSLCPKNLHVTCALDIPGSVVKLIINTDVKDKTSLRVSGRGLVGKPRPAIVCNDHSAEELSQLNLVNFRDMATRGKQGESKTLIEWYMEDKADHEGLMGPKSRAAQYLRLQKINAELAPVVSIKSEDEQPKGTTSCGKCGTHLAFRWYNSENDLKLCHLCHSRASSEEEGDDIEIPNLLTAIRAPLNGSKFGISSPLDHIRIVPQEVHPGPSYKNGKVSISDLLD
ncbi:unnamed protein product [Kuraishia capsulata CBS 1993]|uniref:BAH domain-containing protein n=1 Tax=Kuraishia capsulata CBS 1993 TaxID=1382522 RepID=W6MIX7_9ASCO|nr:uncharacterized protein KUCA_T00002426001 [Kuraishia capsulata CBS 1993]CDK26454.1 unnamed protein product [Kuraishia capsulata CBS 1993]